MNCWLCNRKFNTDEGRFFVGQPTKHHITPRQFKKRKNYIEEKELICSACHRQINRMFTNKELKSMTKEELKDSQKVRKWIKWIRKE